MKFGMARVQQIFLSIYLSLIQFINFFNHCIYFTIIVVFRCGRLLSLILIGLYFVITVITAPSAIYAR